MGDTRRQDEIGAEAVAELRAMWSRAEVADGVAPVSETFGFALDRPREGVVHLVRYAADAGVVGYAQVAGAGSDTAVAELVVDPEHRRQGHGGALLEAALAEGARSVWAHGMLPAAAALARSAGLSLTRSLHRMARPLTAQDAVAPDLPEGFSARPFVPGEDDEEWVRLNAAAFASHPEQGRITIADLHERMAQPWFDPAGLILVTDDETGGVVGFHWTKVDPPRRLPGENPSDADTTADDTGEDGGRDGTGEVYVVGVDPAYQGRGLGGPLTRLGLTHLAGLGLTEVDLYVDGDNSAARHTYSRLGFEDVASDAQYSRSTT